MGRIPMCDETGDNRKWLEYGIGRLDVPFAKHFVGEIDKCVFKNGLCTTGNSLTATEQDEADMKKSGAVVKDMEAASFVWVCKKFKQPCLVVKTIACIVDFQDYGMKFPAPDQLERNVQAAGKKITDALDTILTQIVKKGGVRAALA